MMLGHYTALIARGSGSDLWYTPLGEWSSDISQRKIFDSVVDAVHTGILGLPTGYRASILFVEKEVTAPPVECNPCDC